VKHEVPTFDECGVRAPIPIHARERGVLAVVILTAVMMVVEIVAGYLTGSMALLADGWHMATHVAALGLASAAYALSRRFASHRAFAFGTGKIQTLAGFTSAVVLGFVAITMMVESVSRLVSPETIDFGASLPVAVVGLVVNLVSVALLQHEHHHEHEHEHHHGHEHHHEHDHNHQAALMHVVADALTSVLAIGALVAGRYLDWVFLDPVIGIVGGLIILKWGYDLTKRAAFELLDVDLGGELEVSIREALESFDDVRVLDIHVWSLGRGLRSCVVTLCTDSRRDVREYRAALRELALAHLTVEVRSLEAPCEPSTIAGS
jgi:cation diffusion facilitator family transporter